MINNIRSTFSIQDLEILSGIKAHTIRIWEKRFGILNPTRLGRNIREYSLLDLQKMLNLSLLQRQEHKISELSKLSDSELERKAKLLSLEKFPSNYYTNSIIVSMYSLDDELFEELYQAQSEVMSFRDIFINTYLPILSYIGVLWQTKGIKPAQEHFISNLIYQKIALNISALPSQTATSKKVNVLFLPEGELHEIGLFYLLYHLKEAGDRTIYLGRDIPFNNLFDINMQFAEINWICSFVIDRTDEEKSYFVDQMQSLLMHTKNTCQVVGRIWRNHPAANRNENLTFYMGFDQLVL